MSVNRVADALDQMPEHRHESQIIRDLFSNKIVQNAIDVTAVSRLHFSDKDKLVPVSKTSFHDAEDVTDADYFSMKVISKKGIFQIVQQLDDSVSDKAGDLQNILEKPHLKSVLYAHDKIGKSESESSAK